MTCALIDIGIGNLHSAEKAFVRMAEGDQAIHVTADPEVVRRAERVVLPGDGAFPACRRALAGVPGLEEAVLEAVRAGKPLFGICVGMQLLASVGHEFETVEGLGLIPGEVVRIAPADAGLKVPHMGWNDLVVTGSHPVLDGVMTGDHAYFVHGWQFRVADPAHSLAHVDYGGEVTAIVGRDNVVATQFHPEKSQATGLRIIRNFLEWRP
ncbi:imidazole glycerol phosphate synthase subunit HisH [Rubellimicrobium roseum]|uniref:Imidazole glycerol phosphate synthase subunit HisH n=1 Tax=Rubellimicrobium roseum TaxID=687525 RepID=A0A5C4NB43_9RHOB|nr:imidazole glycerol phosphate synthase subunit HisH [Rubellimicrobium roseum]TNC70851.1 imidazole glycerol phosphate synthase subunit HisH [Rubellimicrobium roseum]